MILDGEILLKPDLPDRRSEEKISSIEEGGFENIYIENVHNPSLLPFALSGKQPSPAVIICPGGGYRLLSWKKEGLDIARWFNSIGVSAFVLKYRLKEYGQPHILEDGKAAIEYVRKNHREFNVDPQKIGITGFSAGGHLAAAASVHFTTADRPNFSILVYPVISMTAPFSHCNTKINLLREPAGKEIMDYYSLEKHIKEDTPPTFLVHTADDEVVDVRNSLFYYNGLLEKGIAAEMHIYQNGPHGFGMVEQMCPAAGDWAGRCRKWLLSQGLINAE